MLIIHSSAALSTNESTSDEFFSDVKDKFLTEQQRSALILIGQAKFSVLFWDIYNSKFYSSTGHYEVADAKQTLLFEITYLKDISQQELIERTVEQWQHLGLPAKKYQGYIQPLQEIWPDISKGDSLALLVSNQGNQFYFNNHYIGHVDDKEFSQHFLDIWLSRKTSQPKLRRSLLGEK